MNRRAILIEGTNTVIELSKVTAINSPKAKQMFHLDQLNDGTWRLIYSSALIENISDVVGLKIIREDD